MRMDGWVEWVEWRNQRSKYLAANSPGQEHIFRQEGHSLGVNSAELGVFKQANNGCLTGFLQGQHGSGGEALDPCFPLRLLIGKGQRLQDAAD